MNAQEIIERVKKHGLMTHGGKFHADEVLSTALLQIVLKDNDLWPQRVFQVPEDTNCFVYDIGRKEFDHHQADAAVYENGKKKAAFGLICEKIIPYFYSQEVYENLLEFIMDIDETDNYGTIERTKEPHGISIAVSSFNTNWDSSEKDDDAFKEAVEWSRTLLIKYLEREESKIRAKGLIKASKREGGILFLEQYAPWQDYVEDEIKFVTYPSIRGGYNIQVNPNIEVSLPKEWLEQYPEGCLFVHQALFLAQFDSVENIVKAIGE